MLEPAAPSEGMPAAAAVAPISLASRPVSVRLRDPNLSSQLRDVIGPGPSPLERTARLPKRETDHPVCSTNPVRQ
jgi:hypothetical protein